MSEAKLPDNVSPALARFADVLCMYNLEMFGPQLGTLLAGPRSRLDERTIMFRLAEHAVHVSASRRSKSETGKRTRTFSAASRRSQIKRDSPGAGAINGCEVATLGAMVNQCPSCSTTSYFRIVSKLSIGRVGEAGTGPLGNHPKRSWSTGSRCSWASSPISWCRRHRGTFCRQPVQKTRAISRTAQCVAATSC